jgi:20S proteasome alpha/beta subunit
MTIGVGYQCMDGVVLCSDRQITSTAGFKYQERKIWSASSPDWSLIFSYAGYPDAATVMFRKIVDGLKDKLKQAKGTFPYERARAVLEEVFFDHTAADLQTMIGFYSDYQDPRLFRTQGASVVDGYIEHIGIGDSSALKYITSFLKPQTNLVDEAVMFAAYLVSVANRYVDGCSGGPDLSILNKDGTVTEVAAGVLSKHEAYFSLYEEQIGKELRALLFSRGGK